MAGVQGRRTEVQGREGRGTRQRWPGYKAGQKSGQTCASQDITAQRGIRSPSQCLLLQVEHVDICAPTGLGALLARNVREPCYIRPSLSEQVGCQRVKREQKSCWQEVSQ